MPKPVGERLRHGDANSEGAFPPDPGALKTFHRKGRKGNVFTNSFCGYCGTRIHHQSKRNTAQISLKPGTLDDTGSLIPTHHVWTRSAQPWVRIPEDAVVFETQPESSAWLMGKKD